MAVDVVSAVAISSIYADITFYLSIAAATVALATLVVGYSQMRIASAKVKLDLYNKRFAVYLSALEYYQCTWGQRDGTKEKAAEFIKSYRESQFLFFRSDGIYDTLTRIKDNASRVVSYDESRKEGDDEKKLEGTFSHTVHEQTELARRELAEDLLLLEEQMNDYIDFKVVEGWHFWWRLRWLKKLWRWAKNRKKK